jgi:hypothetical protein
MTFRPGDTIRLSKLGESRMKRASSKSGRIVGVARDGKISPNAVRVQFDGMKRPVSLHWTYVEPVPGLKAKGK